MTNGPDHDSAGVYFLQVDEFEWRAEGGAPTDPEPSVSPRILVDADACPVKDEIYVVATRYDLPVLLVANTPMAAPAEFGAQMVVVDDHPDAADDWIVAHLEGGDIVITGDVPLAARCLAEGAQAIGTDGRPFDEDSIGHAVATRDLRAALREEGIETSRPRPLGARDRSRFLQALDQAVQRSLRR